MKILIVDAYSVTHIGNAALLDSTLEQLREQFPEAEFTVLAFDPLPIQDLFGCKTLRTLWAEPFSAFSRYEQLWWLIREGLWMTVNALNYSLRSGSHPIVSPSLYTLSPEKRAAVKAYSDADIVVSISGEALQDPLYKRMPLFLYGYWLAHKMGKIVAIFPQSIGPIERRLTRTMARYVLNLCDLVLPRDCPSLRTVNQLGINSTKVHLVPDVAVNQLSVPVEHAVRLLEAEGCIHDRQPLVGMAVSKWKGLNEKTYLPVMTELCNHVTVELGGTVVLFSPNMPFGDEVSDWEMASRVYDAVARQENVVLLSKTYSPREFKGLLGLLDAFVSSRMHAAILSTMAGTPTITVNTQPKLLGYMEMIHQEARACEVSDFTVTTAKILLHDVLENGGRIRAELKEAGRELGERAEIATRLLRQVYEQTRRER